MRPNQLRAILIFLITPATALQFAGYPCTTGTQKPQKISNKNSSFNWVHSIIMRSMNAPHSTYLFTNSCHHISTNGKAPPHSHINLQHPTIPLFAFTKSLCSKRQLSKSFTVEIQPLSTRLINPNFCFIPTVTPH